MDGAHFLDIAVILVLGLLVFGPKRLPELGSQLGRAIREFQQILRNDQPSAAAPPAVTPPPVVTPPTPVAAAEEPAPLSPNVHEAVASESHQD